MNDSICIIVNPAAKGLRAQELISDIRSRDWGAEFIFTEYNCNGIECARQAVQEGFKTIIAAGGDGTINEVVNGLAGADVSFGILPIGTMNVFARQMNIPMDIDHAWQIIKQGKTMEIDLAKANDRYFVQLAGVGFDADVIRETSFMQKRLFGPLSYLITAFKLFPKREHRFKIEANGKEIEGVSVLVGNGKYYGGPLAVFPKANLQDGMLDICVIKKSKDWQLFWNIAGVFTGKHIYSPYIEYFHTKHAKVSSELECSVEVDGETLEKGSVEFKIADERLKLLVP